MKVVLTGASGLLGSALVSSLRGDGHMGAGMTERLRRDGHDVVRLVRRPPTGADEAQWDPQSGFVEPTAVSGADAVINLAGPGLGDRPWTPARQRKLLDDRKLCGT